VPRMERGPGHRLALVSFLGVMIQALGRAKILSWSCVRREGIGSSSSASTIVREDVVNCAAGIVKVVAIGASEPVPALVVTQVTGAESIRSQLHGKCSYFQVPN